MHDRVRTNHDELKQIATSFGQEAEATARSLALIRRQKDLLQGGDWTGQAARKFYDEMDGSVLPALTRLQRALTRAQQVTQKIGARLRQAEADAAAVLRDREAFNGRAAFSGASASASAESGKSLWSQVGGFFKGVGGAAVDLVSGLWTAVTHPIDTLVGLGYAVTHPGEVWDAIKKPYTEAWARGDHGEALGRGAFDIASLFFPPGGGAAVKGGAKAAEVAGDVARVANVASDVARVGHAAEIVGDAARVADRVGDAANLMRNIGGAANQVPFDIARLERVEARLKQIGVAVERNDDVARFLQSQGASAGYIMSEGEPGILMLKPSPARGDVLEELIHFGQHRRNGWKAPVDDIARVQFEVEAQQKMLRIGERMGFTAEEMDHFRRALDFWQDQLPK